jgi:hypothetical protein
LSSGGWEARIFPGLVSGVVNGEETVAGANVNEELGGLSGEIL